jgi:hypothetical protein
VAFVDAKLMPRERGEAVSGRSCPDAHEFGIGKWADMGSKARID